MGSGDNVPQAPRSARWHLEGVRALHIRWDDAFASSPAVGQAATQACPLKTASTALCANRFDNKSYPAVKGYEVQRSLVVHCKQDPYDVYIGRPSKWGNPFEVGVDGTREQVIDLYEQWLLEQPDLLAALDELTGKTLGCWCAPRPCHGEVLTRLAVTLTVPDPWDTVVSVVDSSAVPPF